VSTKFNPNSRTRRPPPQCKKSKPTPIPTPLSGPNPLILNQPLFLWWQWTIATGFEYVTFRFQGWVPMAATNLWYGFAGQSSFNGATVGLRYFFDTNEYIYTGDSKLGGIDATEVTDHRRPWNHRLPFSTPTERVDFKYFGLHRGGLLAVSLTS